MREIKFRAWDKKKKFMLNVMGIDLAKPIFIYGIDYKTDRIYEKDLELMQFAGLKDKNGKEIYEGDICKIIYTKNIGRGTFWYEWIYIVELRLDLGFGFRFIRKTIKRDKIKDNINIKEEWEKFNEHVVIGNIYENPELLNDNKNIKEETE